MPDSIPRSTSGIFLLKDQQDSFTRENHGIDMKLIKIERLRGLSIGCALTAAIAVIGEISAGPKFDATFFRHHHGHFDNGARRDPTGAARAQR
jgi:hypothetical protein